MALYWDELKITDGDVTFTGELSFAERGAKGWVQEYLPKLLAGKLRPRYVVSFKVRSGYASGGAALDVLRAEARKNRPGAEIRYEQRGTRRAVPKDVPLRRERENDLRRGPPTYEITLQLGDVDALFDALGSAARPWRKVGVKQRLQALGYLYTPLGHSNIHAHTNLCWHYYREIHGGIDDEVALSMLQKEVRNNIVTPALPASGQVFEGARLPGPDEFAALRVPGGYCVSYPRYELRPEPPPGEAKAAEKKKTDGPRVSKLWTDDWDEKADQSSRVAGARPADGDAQFEFSLMEDQYKIEAKMAEYNHVLGKIPIIATVKKRFGDEEPVPAEGVTVYFQLVDPRPLDHRAGALHAPPPRETVLDYRYDPAAFDGWQKDPMAIGGDKDGFTPTPEQWAEAKRRASELAKDADRQSRQALRAKDEQIRQAQLELDAANREDLAKSALLSKAKASYDAHMASLAELKDLKRNYDAAVAEMFALGDTDLLDQRLENAAKAFRTARSKAAVSEREAEEARALHAELVASDKEAAARMAKGSGDAPRLEQEATEARAQALEIGAETAERDVGRRKTAMADADDEARSAREAELRTKAASGAQESDSKVQAAVKNAKDKELLAVAAQGSFEVASAKAQAARARADASRAPAGGVALEEQAKVADGKAAAAQVRVDGVNADRDKLLGNKPNTIYLKQVARKEQETRELRATAAGDDPMARGQAIEKAYKAAREKETKAGEENKRVGPTQANFEEARKASAAAREKIRVATEKRAKCDVKYKEKYDVLAPANPHTDALREAERQKGVTGPILDEKTRIVKTLKAERDKIVEGKRDELLGSMVVEDEQVKRAIRFVISASNKESNPTTPLNRFLLANHAGAPSELPGGPKRFVEDVLREVEAARDPGDPQRRNAPSKYRGKAGVPVAGNVFAVRSTQGFNLGHARYSMLEVAEAAGAEHPHAVRAKTNERGHAGVVFMPSTCGGDAYRLRAYVGPEAAGARAPLPEALTGTMVVWRNFRIRRYLRVPQRPRGEMSEAVKELIDYPSANIKKDGGYNGSANWDDAYGKMFLDTGIADISFGPGFPDGDSTEAYEPTSSEKTGGGYRPARITYGTLSNAFNQAYCEVILDTKKVEDLPERLHLAAIARGTEAAEASGIAGIKVDWKTLIFHDPTSPFFLNLRHYGHYNKLVADRGEQAVYPPITVEIEDAIKDAIDPAMINEMMSVYSGGGVLPGLTLVQAARGDSWDMHAIRAVKPIFPSGIATPYRGAFVFYTRGAHRLAFPYSATGNAIHELGHVLMGEHQPANPGGDRYKHQRQPETATTPVTDGPRDDWEVACVMSYMGCYGEFCGRCLFRLRGWKTKSIRTRDGL